MSGIKRLYPFQGKNDFETTNALVTKTLRVSATGNTATGTTTTHLFKKGSIIYGFVGQVTTAFGSTGSATVQIGFTGKGMLSEAYAKTSVDAVGDFCFPSATAALADRPYGLTADDTFDFIVGTAPLNAGKMDIHVTYQPPPNGEADSTFKEYALT